MNRLGFTVPEDGTPRFADHTYPRGYIAAGGSEGVLAYLAFAVDVCEAAEALIVGLCAAVLVATGRNSVLLELQSYLDAAQHNYDDVVDEARSARVPAAFRHDHDHLLAAMRALGSALATSRHITASNLAGGFDQVLQVLKLATLELRRFDRRLPGYRLVGGCGCEVARRAIAVAGKPERLCQR